MIVIQTILTVLQNLLKFTIAKIVKMYFIFAKIISENFDGFGKL